MNDEETITAIQWVDSTDLETADAPTCVEARALLADLNDRLDELMGELVARLKPPLSSHHRRTPLRKVTV